MERALWHRQRPYGTTYFTSRLRLVDKGAVEVSGGSARRKLYYLTERLYNIYYLMRRARGPAPLIDALIRFMEAFYSTDKLKEIGARMAREARGFDGGALAIYRLAFERLVGLPSLEAHREELPSLAPPAFAYAPSEFSAVSAAPPAATDLLRKALALAERGQLEDAVATWDEVVRRFRESDSPTLHREVVAAMVRRGHALIALNRHGEALEACDEVLERFGKSDSPTLHREVAAAMVGRGHALIALDRVDEAISTWGAVVERFGADDRPGLLTMVANAQTHRCALLEQSGRYEEALAVCDEIERRFGNRDEPEILKQVASALVSRVEVLVLLNRLDEALEACDEALRRFGSDEESCGIEAVARTLVYKGALLVDLDRTGEGIAAWDEVVRRFEASDAPTLRDVAEVALCRRAQHELTEGRARIAIAFLDRALLRARAGIPDRRLQGHLIRARAHLAEGDGEACAGDVERALSILPELSTLPRDVLVALIDLSAGVGLERMCDLIKSSPAGDLLLPLRTALERALGMEPRVAREVEEIAEDIRRELLVGRELPPRGFEPVSS